MNELAPDVSASVVDKVPIAVPAAAFSAAEDAVNAMSVGVLSLASVTVTVMVRSDGDCEAASATRTTTVQVLEFEPEPQPGLS